MKKLKILWADDQPDVQATLSSLLAAITDSVFYVSNGEEALKELKAQEYDLLITDLKMPPGDWGGIWLLQEMNKHGLEVPSIVLSGEGTQTETIKALREGASDYVTKDQCDVELESRVIDVVEKQGLDQRMKALIRDGEGPKLEFKETLRCDIRKNSFEKYIEHQVAKTIAAFLNGRGGTLLVGVSDSGMIKGLARDQFQDRDACLRHLDNLIKNYLGDKSSVSIAASISVVDEQEVLRIDCEPSSHPVYLKKDNSGQTEFYIRRQASSVSLPIHETVDYIEQRFRN